MCVVSQHKASLCFLLMSTLLPEQTGVGGKEVICVRVHGESYWTRATGHDFEHSSQGLLSFRREIQIKAAPTLSCYSPCLIM